MIDNPATTLAICTATATVFNLAILKLSPNIKARLRHLIAGIGPSVATLAAQIGTNDSVVATGTDLLILGGSAVAGLAAAIGSTKFVTPRHKLPKN